jgi:hypothetical protein
MREGGGIEEEALHLAHPPSTVEQGHYGVPIKEVVLILKVFLI